MGQNITIMKALVRKFEWFHTIPVSLVRCLDCLVYNGAKQSYRLWYMVSVLLLVPFFAAWRQSGEGPLVDPREYVTERFSRDDQDVMFIGLLGFNSIVVDDGSSLAATDRG